MRGWIEVLAQVFLVVLVWNSLGIAVSVVSNRDSEIEPCGEATHVKRSLQFCGLRAGVCGFLVKAAGAGRALEPVSAWSDQAGDETALRAWGARLSKN
ncbi:MAG TPA: hypothetical protein VN952_03035 [Chthoniobacterales bacterium]|nr:hypothetical protein [Chthoniobacterales bacterium]